MIMLTIDKLLPLLIVIVSIVYEVSSSTDWLIKQHHLIKTGFTNVLWEYIDSSDFQINNYVSEECKLSLNHVGQSINEGQVWPITLFEASGRIPIDFSGSGYIDLGDYDQCLQLTWNDHNENNKVASYCLTSFLPNNQNFSENVFTKNKVISCEYGACIKIGFCLPSDCSSNDLSIIASNALQPYDWSLIKVDHCSVHATFTEKLVQSSLMQKVCFFLMIVIVAIVLIANVLQFIPMDKLRSPNFLRHFLFSSSYRQIVQPNWSSNKMINLLQYSSLMHILVIIGHISGFPFLSQVIGLSSIPLGDAIVNDANLLNVYVSPIVLSDWYFEGIFAYGGLCRTLVTWRRSEPTTPFPRILKSIFTKWVSLLIIILLTMIFHINLPLFISGPVNLTKNASDACLALFYGNASEYINKGHYCLPHFWSILVEMVCILVITVLVFLYKRNTKIGLAANLITMFSSLFYVGYLYYNHSYSAHFFSDGFKDFEQIKDYIENVYLRIETHLWVICFTILDTFVISKNYDKTILKLPIVRSLNSNIYIFGASLFAFQPIYIRLIKPRQNQLILAIYSVVYRFVCLIFWFIIGLRMGDEAREVFVNSIDKNDESKALSVSKMVDYNQKESINSDKMKKIKFYSIIATILKSSYCIHVTVITIVLSLIRRPIMSISGLLLFIGCQIILSIIGGLLFHFIIFGPLTSITVSMRRKIKSK